MADDVVLNKVAAIERAIGRVRQEHAGDDRHLLGEAFDLLQGAGLVDPLLTEKMKKMVGFRNVAIHEYQKLNLDIVRRIIVEHLDDFRAFARQLLRHS